MNKYVTKNQRSENTRMLRFIVHIQTKEQTQNGWFPTRDQRQRVACCAVQHLIPHLKKEKDPTVVVIFGGFSTYGYGLWLPPQSNRCGTTVIGHHHQQRGRLTCLQHADGSECDKECDQKEKRKWIWICEVRLWILTVSCLQNLKDLRIYLWLKSVKDVLAINICWLCCRSYS